MYTDCVQIHSSKRNYACDTQLEMLIIIGSKGGHMYPLDIKCFLVVFISQFQHKSRNNIWCLGQDQMSILSLPYVHVSNIY